MFAILVIAASGLVTTQSSSCIGAIVSQDDVRLLVKRSNAAHRDDANTDRLHRAIKITKGITLPFGFSITSKGNGAIEFPSIGIRIFDEHNDDITFDPYLLCVRLNDVNGDGYQDLVMNGVADHWDDKIDNKLLSSNPISATFLFDPKNKTFVANQVSDEISYWIGDKACSGMKCEK